MLSSEHKQLILESEISASVLGTGETFLLIRLDDGKPLDNASVDDAVARGMRFCGSFGVRNGCAVVQLYPANPEAAYTMVFAGIEFARIAAEHLKPQSEPESKGDEVAWLIRLHSRPDPRT